MPTVLLYGYDYPSIRAAFDDRGWRVLGGDSRNWYAAAHGNLPHVPKQTSVEFGERFVIDCAEHKPDLVVIGKGLDSNVYDGTVTPAFWHIPHEAVERVKRGGAIVLYWTLDDPNDFGFGLSTHLPFAADIIGTCCIGTRESYQRHSEAAVVELWPAYDPIMHPGLEFLPVRDEDRCDFVVVGTPYTRGTDDAREMGPSCSRLEIVREARRRGIDVQVWGPATWLDASAGGDPALASIYRGRAEWSELVRIFGAARVAYNSFVRQAPRYVNDRISIAGVSGAALLMEAQLRLDDVFPGGEVCEYHRRGEPEHAGELLEKLLGDEPRRSRIASAMRDRILAEHTYDRRVARIVEAWDAARLAHTVRRATCCRG